MNVRLIKQGFYCCQAGCAGTALHPVIAFDQLRFAQLAQGVLPVKHLANGRNDQDLTVAGAFCAANALNRPSLKTPKP
ncbi:MAG TPA: hypothetical protein ENK61_04320 [Devosia sp.]|nr:hypothetical protein [Devosia sp.]